MSSRSHPQADRLRGLYVILDPAVISDRDGRALGQGRAVVGTLARNTATNDTNERLLRIADQALVGGARLIQYRDKTRDKSEQLAVCLHLNVLCRQAGALFFVNDHADIAMAVAADGVHVGQRDMPVAAVRRIMPETMLIGASTNNLEESWRAIAGGADYVSVGRLFATDSKMDTRPATLEMLHAVKAAVPVPVCGIGGINESNIGSVIDSGAEMAAVISAVISAPDVREATRRLSGFYVGPGGQGEVGLRELPYPPVGERRQVANATPIYADWNETDEHGMLPLNYKRSAKELGVLGDALVDGVLVRLNIQDEFEVEATLIYSMGCWRAIPDRSRISYPSSDAPTGPESD